MNRAMLRRASLIALLLAILMVIAILFLHKGVPGPLARYPYVECVTARSAVISWATDRPENTPVEVSSPGTEARLLASPSETPLHTVQLTGLASETIYTYRILLDGHPISEAYSFKTAPTRNDVPVRFFVIGDSGTGNRRQYQVAEQIERLAENDRVDFGIHTGDVIYGESPDTEQDSRYFLPYHLILSHVPLWLSIGNHNSEAGKLEAVLDLHTLPGNERWYSFDYGPLHAVVLDSASWESEEQRSWLERDLSANRDRPWICAVFHFPPYAWPYADREDLSQGSCLSVRKAWSPILERYGVDIVFNGHSHSYERTRRIRDYEPEGNGIYYVVTGGGGGRLHSVAKEVVEPGLMEACVDNVYHFLWVEIDGDRLSLEAIDYKGKVFDRFSFTQKNGGLGSSGA